MKEIMLVEKDTKDCVNSRIPSLSDEDLEWVREHERLQWAHGWMSALADGQAHSFTSDGILIQKVDNSTMRIISVTDHEWCFRGVAFMRATFEAVDVAVQLDPYTVIVPYSEPDETEQAQHNDQTIGMEVA